MPKKRPHTSVLRAAAKKTLGEIGYAVERTSKSGRQEIYKIVKEGNTSHVVIKTTKNGWLGFKTKDEGRTWDTLNDVDYVCVARLIDEDAGLEGGVDVHMIDKTAVWDAFEDNWHARSEANEKVTENDNSPIWACMDPHNSKLPESVGSGFATDTTLIASYTAEDLEGLTDDDVPAAQTSTTGTATIAEILDEASQKIAVIAGMASDDVSVSARMRTPRPRD